jgi:hypothetical protein
MEELVRKFPKGRMYVKREVIGKLVTRRFVTYRIPYNPYKDKYTFLPK